MRVEMPMAAASRRVLEVDAVLEALAGYVQTAMGAQRVRQRRPSLDADWIRQAQDAVQQVRDAAAQRGMVALGSAEPIDDVLASVSAEGSVIEAVALRRVAALARVSAAVQRQLRNDADRWPRLGELAASMPALGRLREQIEGLFGPDGEIRDDASPELARLRRTRRRLHLQVRDRMERLARDDRYRDVLQEGLVTERSGRFVVPVRSDQRDKLRGIVHDTSSTRQTLYVEPMELVDDQNRLAELAGGERAEVARLLLEASGHVRAARSSLEAAQAIVAELDELQALARYAIEVDAVRPEVSEGGFALRGAYHPLAARETFVPLDLEAGAEVRAIVVTGPNTGGKTVALKTLGLLALMHQSGIPVPATEARLPIFTRVHADIGDEQSLAANLSTFSAHLAHITEFLASCPAGSLVLLDELGTGTDPAEGAALGIALLLRFMDLGAVVLASTHHDALKSFAHADERAVNAAMEFDTETLAPTYRVRIGRPGRSNALEIAARLGLDAELIASARGLMQADAVQLDDIIRRLEAESGVVEQQRRELAAERARFETQGLAAEESERLRLRAWEQLERDARDAVREAVERVRREGSQKLAELERQDAPGASSERSRADRRARWSAAAGAIEGRSDRRLQARLQRQRDVRDAVSAPSKPPEAGAAREAERDQPLVRGTRVSVSPFGLSGRVFRDWAAGDGAAEVEVDVGGKRLIVNRDQVEAVQEGSKTGRASPLGGGTRYRRRYDVKPEIDLHGMRVEEALQVVDKYLDDALLADLSTVRLIHGYGRLRLRDAIHAVLAKHHGVVEFGAAGPGHGGAGVTIVTLGH